MNEDFDETDPPKINIFLIKQGRNIISGDAYTVEATGCLDLKRFCVNTIHPFILALYSVENVTKIVYIQCSVLV